jgi:glyoxylase-like metal-dependent hydrolase (beta-lactamase superfamily II)
MTDGMRIQLSDRELRAIATPGHTAGHVSFVDDAGGLLFAGDHVLPHITPSIGLEVFGARLPLGDFLDSLALVRDLPVSQVLPAHGEPFTDLARRVDELVAHHQVRLDAAAAAVASGAATVDAVARLLPWTRREVDFTSLDVFNRQLAIRETLAHLDLLVEHGRLRISHKGGVRLYAPLDATA